MSKEGYVALAIGVIVLLVAIFTFTFVKYVKAPPPKGCENFGRDESKCGDCPEESCRFYTLAHDYAEAKKQEKQSEESGQPDQKGE